MRGPGEPPEGGDIPAGIPGIPGTNTREPASGRPAGEARSSRSRAHRGPGRPARADRAPRKDGRPPVGRPETPAPPPEHRGPQGRADKTPPGKRSRASSRASDPPTGLATPLLSPSLTRPSRNRTGHGLQEISNVEHRLMNLEGSPGRERLPRGVRHSIFLVRYSTFRDEHRETWATPRLHVFAPQESKSAQRRRRQPPSKKGAGVWLPTPRLIVVGATGIEPVIPAV